MTKLLADSNRASLREIVESTSAWGSTPAAGVTRALRFSSSSITVKKGTTVANEIRADRMVSSVVETSAESGGDINFEFSAGNQDSFMERALMSYFSRPMTFDFFRGIALQITAPGTVTYSGQDITGYLTVGRRVKLSGFKDPANNTFGQIATATFAGNVTTVTLTGPTLVVENGSAVSTMADANDILVMNSTSIRSGTAGAAAFDSNGTNAFAAVRAAGQLVAGQIIHVEGLGYETGTVTLTAPASGDTITLNDGVHQPLVLIAGTDFSLTGTDTQRATALAAAINANRVAGLISFAASAATNVVTIRNLNRVGGSTGPNSASMVGAAFSGGDTTVGGFFTVVNATDDVITVDRPVSTFIQGSKVTIRGSMLRNPGVVTNITPQSSSIETRFYDVQQSFLADGLRTGGFMLNIASNAIITGNAKLEGRQTKRFAAAQLANSTNYTVLDANGCENVSATANVGAVSVNGLALTTAIKSIEFSVEGNLRKQEAVGSKFPVGISAGRLNIKGKLDAYFADGVMFDHFLSHDTASLRFPIIDVDGNTYYFTIPSFKIMSDPIAPAGIDQDVMEVMEFEAFRDAATQCMIQIDRFSSVKPVTAF